MGKVKRLKEGKRTQQLLFSAMHVQFLWNRYCFSSLHCWLTCCLSYRLIQNCLWVIVTAPLRSIYSRVCCRWFGGSRSVWVRWCLQSGDKVISGVEGYSAAFCHHEDYCTFQMCLHLLQIEPRLLTACSSGRKKKVRKLWAKGEIVVRTFCVLCVGAFYLSVYLSLTTETEETCDIFNECVAKTQGLSRFLAFFSPLLFQLRWLKIFTDRIFSFLCVFYTSFACVFFFPLIKNLQHWPTLTLVQFGNVCTFKRL